MEIRSVHLHECCVVPYRLSGSGTEFCLLTPLHENRWEFPKVQISRPSDCNSRNLRAAAESAGLRGRLVGNDPLGSFVASRGAEVRSMVGYLLLVQRVEESWTQSDTHRRLWCLAEEARVRIRRKPLRRFIDLALQSLRDTLPGK